MAEQDKPAWDHTLEDPNSEMDANSQARLDAAYENIGHMYGPDARVMYPSLLRAALADLQPTLLEVPKKPGVLNDAAVDAIKAEVQNYLRRIETGAKDLSVTISDLLIRTQLQPDEFEGLSEESKQFVTAALSFLDLDVEHSDPRYPEFFEGIRRYLENHQSDEKS